MDQAISRTGPQTPYYPYTACLYGPPSHADFAIDYRSFTSDTLNANRAYRSNMLSLRKWIRNALPPRRPQDLRKEDHASRPDRGEIAVDPLVAARDYNIKNSRLASLPDDILLLILDSIGDDVLTLYSLRRVSQVFRRIIYEPRIWRHMRTSTSLERYWYLSEDDRLRLKLHLQRDGMCEDCMFWCEFRGNRLSRKSIQDQELNSSRLREDSGCKFNSGSDPLRRLHCSPCGTHHDPHAFSSPHQDPGRQTQDMGCLGRQGAVQLCEHVHLSWSDIESHIAQWEKDRPRPWPGKTWKSCLAQFKLECHDPSHDTRCTEDGIPSWPQARLQVHDLGKPTVVLTLEWKPHSGLHVPRHNTDGRTPAEQLRRLFRRQRDGPAAILFPSAPSNPLPEMTCYNTSSCRCVYYEGGAAGKTATSERSPNQGRPCAYPHYFDRISFGTRSERLHMAKHWPCGEGGPACLVTAYQRFIPLFSARPDGAVNPSHAWFHAMDPDTYPRPASHVLPLCRNIGCMNYFKRPKVFRCDGWPSTVNYPCTCEG